MTTPSRPGSLLGTRVTRTEDPELLRGARRYVADLPFDGLLHAVFARSDVPHGRITSIHTDEAVAHPGVVAVLTAAELGVAPHHGFAVVHEDFASPPLADGVVRFVGEPYAVVLAESIADGVDAAATIWADIEPLTTLVHPEDALAAEAPPLFPEHGSNLAQVLVDRNRVDLADADVVVRGRYVNPRMAVAPMERSEEHTSELQSQR